jgi:hypothetical protein
MLCALKTKALRLQKMNHAAMVTDVMKRNRAPKADLFRA